MLKILLFTSLLTFQAFPTDALIQETPQNVVGIVEKLSKIVLSHNFSSIIDSIDALHPYLPSVIKAAYNNNLSNIKTILDFIKSCPKFKQLPLLETLLDEMYENDHVWSEEGFKLADILSELDRNTTLVDRFPSSMISLYFREGYCKIKSVHFNEYFYAADQFFAFDKWRRNTFTYTKQTSDGKMVFDIRKVRENIFTLRSEKYNEFLYAEEDNYAHSAQRRRIFTYRSGVPGNREWEVKPKAHKPNIFYLRNVRFNELLFADPNILHNKQRRNTFTERVTDFAVETTKHWYLEC